MTSLDIFSRVAAGEREFHMWDAHMVMALWSTRCTERWVENPELGAMGSCEITIWDTHIGATITCKKSNGGMSVYLKLAED